MDPILGFFGEYRFLSNFHILNLAIPESHPECNFSYPTVEHAYQAAKTTDIRYKRRLASCNSPMSAKRHGYKVPIRDDWDDARIGVMRKLLEFKFDDPELKEKLIATHPRNIYEVNTWNDKFWGCDHDLNGENWMGRLLMEIRESIMEDERVGL